MTYAPTREELAQGSALLRQAFEEDLGPGAGHDLTAVAVAGRTLQAHVVARQAGTVCGVVLAELAFQMRGAQASALVADGARVEPGAVLVQVDGEAAAVLSAERTALNFLQQLSGTATLTARYVEAVAGTSAQILDTRKTIPGMRALQRWAVRCGGGVNHRFGLAHEAMLKDTHLAACADVQAAVDRIRAATPGVVVHVEADTLERAMAAAAAGADLVLLDNMTLAELEESVRALAGAALTEASGGVTLASVAAIAATGVDRISIGELTHSARAFDAALDAAPQETPAAPARRFG